MAHQPALSQLRVPDGCPLAPPAGTRTLANLVAGMVMPLPPLLQLWVQACQVALTTADYCSLEVGVGLWLCSRAPGGSPWCTAGASITECTC